jgi:hypothetical protein
VRHRLAVTVHDPGGHFLSGLQRLRGRLTSTFAGIGALITDDNDDSDVDHVLRWVEARPDEVDAALAAAATTDMLVIGRTDAAMARSPRRLRETEKVVNHVYELMTGRRWDLTFAVCCLSPATPGS